MICIQGIQNFDTYDLEDVRLDRFNGATLKIRIDLH